MKIKASLNCSAGLKTAGTPEVKKPDRAGREKTAKKNQNHPLREKDYFEFNTDRNPDISKRIRKAINSIPEPVNPWDKPKIDPVKIMRVDEVREKYGLTGKGVTVAVVDSGYKNREYQPKYWKDFQADSPEPADEMGHGTHCVGDVLNIAPGADIAAVRVLFADTEESNRQIAQAFDWVAANKDELGIKILSHSGGDTRKVFRLYSPPCSSPPYFFPVPDPIDAAVARVVKSGVSFITAAGNEGPQPCTIGSTADAPDAVTVAATKDGAAIRDSSSRGPSLLVGHEKPDVAAAGEFIVSLAAPRSNRKKLAGDFQRMEKMDYPKLVKFLNKHPKYKKFYRLPEDLKQIPPEELLNRVRTTEAAKHPTLIDKNYLATSGTSMACPLTAGVTALMYEAKPDLTPQQVKTILKESAVDLGYDGYTQGAGLVDAMAAVEKVYELKEKDAKNQTREG